MSNSYRMDRMTGCETCEDFGLTYDLVSAESVLVSRSVAKSETHLQELAVTIESAIIPRLLVNHGLSAPVVENFNRSAPPIGAAMINSFVTLLISQDNSKAPAFLEGLMDRGIPMERLLLELLAPAARLMGEMWTADLCSFVDVTLGLSRIQQMLRQCRGLSNGQRVAAEGKGRALLVPAPGEQHTFGLRVVEEFLLRDGWEVRSNLRASEAETVELMREEAYDFVGFSVSVERLLAPLVSAIRNVRKTSRNRSARVMVGGVVFVGHPEYVDLVKADAVIFDAREAVLVANEWYQPVILNS